MKSRLVAAGLCAVALGAGGWLALDASGTRGRQKDEPSPGERGAARCPSRVGHLPRDAIARATDAVLSDAPRLFRGKKRRGMRAISAEIASDDNRGTYARVSCGRKVFKRTVVVTVEFPAELPSASLSSSTVLVSPSRGRYKAWAIVH